MPQDCRRSYTAIADKVFTYAPYNKEMYDMDGLPVPVSSIPLGVSSAFFDETEKLDLGIPEDQIKLLYVGGAVYRKGVDILLAAWDQLFESRDDVTLIIKDLPFYDQDISSRLDKYKDRVVYLRQNMNPADLPKLYRAADVFVFPTRGEGFGLPLLEAMASGLMCCAPTHTGCGSFFSEKEGVVVESFLMPVNVGTTVHPASLYDIDPSSLL